MKSCELETCHTLFKMNSVHCFVSGCSQKRSKGFFKVPQKNNHLFVKWRVTLGEQNKKRLSKSDYVCHNHFKEEDVIKGRLCGAKFIENCRWKLKAEAIPTLNFSTGIICVTLCCSQCILNHSIYRS